MPFPNPLHRAARIIRQAEQARLAHDGSYAFQAGVYQAQIKTLCAELATLAGADYKPAGLIETMFMGDAEAPVEFEYEPGEEAQIFGPPERCHEGYAEQITILNVLINGVWTDPTDVVAPELIERWTQEAAQTLHDKARDAADEAAEAAYEARREAAAERTW